MNRHLPRTLIGCVIALALTGVTGTACADAPNGTIAPRDAHPTGNQTAPLESHIEDGDSEGTRAANGTSNLFAASPSSGKTRGRASTQTAGGGDWQTFAEGYIIEGVHDIEDPSTSIYVGGNMTVLSGTETEGSVVVDGDLTMGNGSEGLGQSLLAGKVMWGMGFNPPSGADMLAVGGKFRNPNVNNPQWVGGSARFGGDVKWNDSNVVDAKGNHSLYVATKSNMANLGWATDSSSYLAWTYDNLPSDTAIRQNLGKTEALKVNINGKRGDEAKIVDYNGYASSTLVPLSDRLKRTTANGTITFEKAPAAAWRFFDNRQVQLDDEGRIVFHGTGTAAKERQVFSLDLSELESARKRLGVSQWSLDFRDIPENQAIVINAVGSGKQVWRTGWRIWVNGQDHGTYINSGDDSKSRFRSISSRIMWNFPDVEHLTLDRSHGIYLGETDWYATNGKDLYSTDYGKGALLPGSIVLPHGDMTDYADTNGRLLVGGNLDFVVWEHHNAPWVGFDEPQKFTLQGKTKTAGVEHRKQDSVHDTLTIRAKGSNISDESAYELQAQGFSFTLNYRAKDSDEVVSATLPSDQSVAIPCQGTVTLDSPSFTPGDLGMSAWRPGDYWFDVSADRLIVLHAGTGTTANITSRAGMDGSSDADERFRMEDWIGSATTKAMETFDRAGGDRSVHDAIAMEYEDGPDTVRIISTLHWSADPDAVTSSVSCDKEGTVSAMGNSPGPDFTPNDFGWSQWKAGKYWYDLTIPAQGDFQKLTVEGALDDQESWIAKNPFAINLRKVAYLGEPGSGAWTNQPVPDASLTLQEMADGTFETVKPDSEPISLNTDENGDALAPDMTIGSGETRWYRLSETAAPDGYLRAEGYWLIEATGTEDGVGVSVTGSDDTMGGLTHGVSSEGIVWTIGIGNRVEGRITPPVTGGSFDTGRIMLASGGLASAMMLAGATLLRSRGRGTSFGAHAGRHAQV